MPGRLLALAALLLPSPGLACPFHDALGLGFGALHHGAEDWAPAPPPLPPPALPAAVPSAAAAALPELSAAARMERQRALMLARYPALRPEASVTPPPAAPAAP